MEGRVSKENGEHSPQRDAGERAKRKSGVGAASSPVQTVHVNVDQERKRANTSHQRYQTAQAGW